MRDLSYEEFRALQSKAIIWRNSNDEDEVRASILIERDLVAHNGSLRRRIRWLEKQIMDACLCDFDAMPSFVDELVIEDESGMPVRVVDTPKDFK